MPFRSPMTAGALAVWAVPIVRRLPAWVRRTRLEVVGEGRSAALWAWEMTTRRRAIVAAFEPLSASSARYAATVSSLAGRGTPPRRSQKLRKSRQPAAEALMVDWAFEPPA